MDIITISIIGRSLAAIACVVMAGLIALNGNDGWGWFLFAALLLGVYDVSVR